MGFLQNQSLDISEIRTETSTEPSPIIMEEDNVTEVFQDQEEKKFITSPVDIEVYQCLCIDVFFILSSCCLSSTSSAYGRNNKLVALLYIDTLFPH